MQKQYRVREKAPDSAHAVLQGHPELVRELLFARGISGPGEAERFLSPSFERDSHDPFLLPDMEKAVERIRAALAGGELICVWSDYDCDGIPGGVALTEFLRDIGGCVRHYIPHRHREGYGLNREGLEEVIGEGAKLVITVDLGTTDHDEIAFARSRGIDVIVADHHLPPPTLPEALAVLNPYRADSRYPFQGLCGAGVAWKLIQGVLARDRFGMPEGKEKWLLDLIGLATLSDMVPLVGENRTLASYGLIVLRRSRRPGVRSLLKLLRIDANRMSEDDVTFMVTPRINAASRMDNPMLAARLLSTRDGEEGEALARELQALNDERKGVVASIVKEARGRLLERERSGIIVMGSPRWRPGVLGLVANSLMESEGVPVFLWGRHESELLKGSCRSDGSINVVELMSAAGDVLEDFGGHDLSGGFSLREERAHELSSRLERAYEAARAREMAAREVLIDAELDLQDAPRALGEISRLAPFGEGNRKPLFLFPGVSISGVRTFGKGGDHLELGLSRGDLRLAGVSFFSTPDSFMKPASAGARCDVVGHLERDFRGRPRLRIVDLI